MKKIKNKGFTLTELIIVIVIIGILAAVLIPSLTRYIDSARDAAAKQEASTYVTALSNYNIEVRAGSLSSNINSFESYCDDLGLDSSNIITIDVITSNVTPTSMIIADSNTSYQSQGFLLWVKHNRMVAYNHNTGLDQVINLSKDPIVFKDNAGNEENIKSKITFTAFKANIDGARENNPRFSFNLDSLTSADKTITTNVVIATPGLEYTYYPEGSYLTYFKDVNGNTIAFSGFVVTGFLDSTNQLIIPEYVTQNGITDKVVGIGNCDYPGVFEEKSFTTVEIPSNVEFIYDASFYGCENLTTVFLSKNSQLKAIGDYAFEECTNLEKFSFPSMLAVIGQNAFLNCISLKEISFSLDSNLEIIKANAFSGCSELVNIILPQKLKIIGSAAFKSCTKLETINIPSSVTEIISQAFSDCDSLKTINIPSSVIKLDGDVFKGCDSLATIYTEYAEGSTPEFTTIGHNSTGWANDWCPTGCTVVWNTSFKNYEYGILYVDSFSITTVPATEHSIYGTPYRTGYNFVKWNETQENGVYTLTAVWSKK